MSNIIEINDFHHKELDIYSRISEVQLLHYFEPKPGIFIAESPKVIERALDAGYTPISFLMETQHVTGQGKELIKRCPNIPVFTAHLDILTKLTGFQLTRGMLCAMYRKELPTVSDVCKNSKRIAVLENIVNPTNIGAIFRCAAALNMDAILLTSACCDPLYRRSIRVSMGTVFQIPWTFLQNNNISHLRDFGYKTVAMALTDDSVSINHPSLLKEEKLAIVLGTEGDGLAKTTIAHCDYRVKIPMTHNVDSLNVAAASAVAFWELGNNK